MLDRAGAARGSTPLDGRDLRGWHFVLTGGVLTTLAPYGFDAGMTGRYAYQQDDLLPDRSSQILGLAAAQLFGLPAEPFGADRTERLVVAYDLTAVEDGDLVAALRDRAPGEILYEHVTCWTSPPR